MRVADVEQRFREFALAAGVDLETGTGAELVGVMVDWYAAERVDDLPREADSDMLLFQWGTYDWGDGPSFQYDITRQVIDDERSEDDHIWQLSVTAHYPEAIGVDLPPANQWCRSPAGLDDFRSFVASSPATAAVAAHTPSYIEVHFGQAG